MKIKGENTTKKRQIILDADTCLARKVPSHLGLAELRADSPETGQVTLKFNNLKNRRGERDPYGKGLLTVDLTKENEKPIDLRGCRIDVTFGFPKEFIDKLGQARVWIIDEHGQVQDGAITAAADEAVLSISPRLSGDFDSSRVLMMEIEFKIGAKGEKYNGEVIIKTIEIKGSDPAQEKAPGGGVKAGADARESSSGTFAMKIDKLEKTGAVSYASLPFGALGLVFAVIGYIFNWIAHRFRGVRPLTNRMGGRIGAAVRGISGASRTTPIPVGVAPLPPQDGAVPLYDEVMRDVGQVQRWMTDLGLDFMEQGRTEDRGLFAPRLRFPPTFFVASFDPNLEPRHNLWKAAGGAIFGAGAYLLYQFYDPRLIVAMPFIFAVIFFFRINWVMATRFVGLLTVFISAFWISPFPSITTGLILTFTAVFYRVIAPVKQYLGAIWSPERFRANQLVQLVEIRGRLNGIRARLTAYEFAAYQLTNLRRPLRSMAVPGGHGQPGGAVGNTDTFGVILNNAIAELDNLIANPLPRIRNRWEYGAKLAPLYLTLPIYLIMWYFFGCMPALITACLIFIPMLYASAWLLYRVRLSQMLLYPANTYKNVIYRTFFGLYNGQSEAPLQALDVWRFLHQLGYAVSKIMERDDNLNHVNIQNMLTRQAVQETLDEDREGSENVSGSAKARGPYDSTHLSELEKWGNKTIMILRLFFWLGICLYIISLGAFLVTVVGLYWFNHLATTGAALSLSSLPGLFDRNFHILDPFRGSDSIREFFGLDKGESLGFWRWLGITLSQNLIDWVITVGLLIFTIKFIFYTIGLYARKYPNEERPFRPLYHGFTYGILQIGLPLLLLWGLPLFTGFGFNIGYLFTSSATGLLFKVGLAVIAIRASVVFMARFIARNRFAAIVEDDKLYEGPDMRLRADSTERFMETVLGMYNDDDRRVIIQATRGGKASLSERDRRAYERLMGKGVDVSGQFMHRYDINNLDADEFTAGSIRNIYASLINEEILNRMSGTGFEELRDWADRNGTPHPLAYPS